MVEIVVSIAVLTVMELVLGIDNIIFIGFLANNIEDKKKADQARKIGLVIALLVRIVALSFVSYLAHLVDPVFHITTDQGIDHPVSVRDIILFCGGLFLIHKSVSEIHEMFGDGDDKEEEGSSAMIKVIFQIVLIDLVFSADSILTAIGLVDQVEIMIAAVVLSMGLMFFLSGKISDFIESRPTLKVLALAFLVMIGTMLVMEGAGIEMDKGYVYFAMAFAGIVEAVNSKVKLRKSPKSRKKRVKKSIEADQGNSEINQ
ncbi:MAG: TerC family protein [Cytophagales bacterium]|nr:TerC family protein [Cytophagales bacterium]